MVGRSLQLLLHVLFCASSLSARPLDGILRVTSIVVEYLEPSFSKSSLLPSTAPFSLLRSSDSISNLCSKKIVPDQLFFFVDPVGEGAGLVAAHGNCSIFEEATNAYKLGYSYIVILADFDSSPANYNLNQEEKEDDIEEMLLGPIQEDLRKLDMFVAVVSSKDFERAIYLSSRYQNTISKPLQSEDEIKEIVLKFERHESPLHLFHRCYYHVRSALHHNRHHFLRASAFICLDAAIDAVESMRDSLGIGENLIIRSIDLALLLMESEYFDEAVLLSHWAFRSILLHPMDTLTDIHTFPSQFSKLSSLLFRMGEWASARNLLQSIVANACKIEEENPGMLRMATLCQESCSIMFLASFSTLESNAQTHVYFDENDDWTVDIDGSSSAFGDTTASVHPIDDESELFVCIERMQHYEFTNMEFKHDEKSHSVSSWIDLIGTSYSTHPVFRVGAGELQHLSGKWGLVNVMKYVVTMLDMICNAHATCSARKHDASTGSMDTVSNTHGLIRHQSDSDRSHTTHMAYFLSFLGNILSTCDEINASKDIVDTDIYCVQSIKVSGDKALFQTNEMPLSSYITLKKYSGGRNKKALRRTGIRMFQNDLMESHIRLYLFWKKYGSFSSSQNHFLARIARIQCLSKSLRADILKTQQADLCSPEQVQLIKAEVADIGCLFQHNLMLTPAVFGSNGEFNQFREDQLKYLFRLQDMILPLVDATNDSVEMKLDKPVEMSLFEASKYPEKVITSLRERQLLIADERKVSETPAGSSIGYAFEQQEIVKAMAPSSAVASSGAKLLEHGNALQNICETSGLRPELIAPKLKETSDSIPERISVGFLSRFVLDNPIAKSMQQVIAGINSSMFDVHVFCLCCTEDGNEGHVLSALRLIPRLIWWSLGSGESSISSDQCIRQLSTNPLQFFEAGANISSASLDVLIYPDLGNDKLTLSFAHQRLARLQAVYFGYPLSQHINSIDYYISSEMCDVHYPQCQYPRLYQAKCPFTFSAMEQVVMLKDLIVPESLEDASSASPLVGSLNPFSPLFDALPFSSFAIDAMDRHVYLVPHAISMFSTAFIRTIAYILLNDSAGFVVVLYDKNERLWVEKLRRSIHYHIKKLYCHTNKVDRAVDILKMFPEMHSYVTQPDCVANASKKMCKLCCECTEVTYPHASARRLHLMSKPESATEYRKLVSQSSVVLDSFPVGMDLSAMDVFLTGRPIATLPYYQTSPSFVVGLLRKMRIDDEPFVARNISDYVSKAIALAQRSSDRDDLMSLLQRKSREINAHNIAQTSEFIKDFEKLMLRIRKSSVDAM